MNGGVPDREAVARVIESLPFTADLDAPGWDPTIRQGLVQARAQCLAKADIIIALFAAAQAGGSNGG